MKLIIIPLACMAVLVLFSLTGFGEEVFGEDDLYLSGTNLDYYYDENGAQKVLIETMAPVDSDENFHIVGQGAYSTALFYNDTDIIHTHYELYYDTGAEHPVIYKDVGKRYSGSSGSTLTVDMNSGLAFIAVCVGVTALVSVIGLQIFGSGESEFSLTVITMFTGLLAFWAILSYGGLPMITSIPYGSVLYVIFTLMYAVGCFQAVSSGSAE